MLKLFNTLTKKKEEFKPIKEGQVGMYNCGPTVYDYAHIGNLRSYLFADTLRRTLEWNGYAVRQVMNITDFGHLSSDADSGEDKMLKGLEREGKPHTLEAMRELADFYARAFQEDLVALNIETPTSLPYASDHIPEQIDIIKGLEDKGFIYTTKDGVYFDTSKDKNYGKLGGLSQTDSKDSRVLASEKKNPRDFALWKLSDDNLGWDSPWGKGFPGWHIECSAMSMKYLGDHFDIHTGGTDHIPIHHNNEIAQSENFTSEQFVNYWLHNAFINTEEGEKMAKSKGNFLTRKTLVEKEYDPLSYRYLILIAHYRSQLEFSWEALDAAQSALNHLRDRLSDMENASGKPNKKYIKQFTEYINDDLSTPEAVALVWELLKDDSVPDAEKKVTIETFDNVLGLSLSDVKTIDIPNDVQELIEKREVARKNERWDEADVLRLEIEKHGFTLKDTDSGTKVKTKFSK